VTCMEFRPQISAYVADEMIPAVRSEFRSHLTACGECRAAAVAIEPTLLFSAPMRDEERPENVRAVLANVRAAVAVRETARRIERPAASDRAHRRAVVGLASAATLAGLALLSPRAQAPGLPAARQDATATASIPATSDITPARLSKSLEPVSPSSATVYEWNTDRGKSDGMKIVWIVDRSIEL
jgi:anti-sigma factor RsiW